MWKMSLTATKTFSKVSKCHLLFGANRSAASTILLEHGALNSWSAFSKNINNSLIIVRIFWELTKANESSIALLRIETSGSKTHFKRLHYQSLFCYVFNYWNNNHRILLLIFICAKKSYQQKYYSPFKHSSIVDLCLCTAEVSTCTVLSRVFKATYLMFLSLFNRKRPNIFTAKT